MSMLGEYGGNSMASLDDTGVELIFISVWIGVLMKYVRSYGEYENADIWLIIYFTDGPAHYAKLFIHYCLRWPETT